jgi:hypothetical protein
MEIDGKSDENQLFTFPFPITIVGSFNPMPSPPNLQSSPRIFLRAWARAVPALGVLIQVLGEKPQEDRRRSEARPHIRRCTSPYMGTNTKGKPQCMNPQYMCACHVRRCMCLCIMCVHMCACVHVCCVSACAERNISSE